MNTENKKDLHTPRWMRAGLIFFWNCNPFRGVRREAKRAWLAWRLERLEA